MTNVIDFPRRHQLVQTMTPQDCVVSISQNAFAALVVSLDDDRLDVDRLSAHLDLEVIRNCIWGLAERAQGMTTPRTQLLDTMAVALALRNPT